MVKMQGSKYAIDFRNQSAKQVVEGGKNKYEVAKQLGIARSTLDRWIKEYQEAYQEEEKTSDAKSELRRLRAELKRVTEERDILKEAVAYFAIESRKSTRS